MENKEPLSWEKPSEEKKEAEGPRISVLWYSLPLLFFFLGGLIGWALLRDQNKEKAVHLFKIGMIMTAAIILLKYFISIF
jgi:hypothetical protein